MANHYIINHTSLGTFFDAKQLSDWRKRSSPLSRHWFGSAIRGRRSRRPVKHSETSHWIIVHHRVSCGFISTWHEHVVSHRSVSFCVVSSCVSHCHSTGRSSTAIADTCGAGISWGFPWKPTATFDKRACLRRDLTKYTKVGHFVSQCLLENRSASFGKRCLDFHCVHVLGASLEKSRQSSKSSWSGNSGIVAVWNWELGKHWNVIQGKNMEQLKNKMCRIKINLASKRILCWCFILCLFCFSLHLSRFSEVVEVIKMWRHAQPNSAMSDPIIWNLRIFMFVHPGTAQVFSSPAPHPLRLRPHQEERKGELSELHKNSNARFRNCLLEFGKLKEQKHEMFGTYGCFKVSIFPKFDEICSKFWDSFQEEPLKIGAFLLLVEVSVGQVSEPSEFSCFLKEADRLLHWTSKW